MVASAALDNVEALLKDVLKLSTAASTSLPLPLSLLLEP
jgi:hypothetical protein